MCTIETVRSVKMKIDARTLKREFCKLWTLSNEHALLYNHLLTSVYDRLESGGRIDFAQTNQDYKNFRNSNNLTIPSKSAQNTSRVFMGSIKSYYALKKNYPDTKFPKRFKSTRNFSSFIYDMNSGKGGFKIDNGNLIILKPNIIIPLPKWVMDKVTNDNIKTITFHGDDHNIYCSFAYSRKILSKELDPTRHISFDPGVKTLLTGVTCDGEIVQYPNFNFSKEDKSNDKLRSNRDKKKKYSKRYQRLSKTLKRRMAKTSNKRKDYHHKVTKNIIDFCVNKNIGTIIHGDIKTKKLPEAKFASKSLNRATQNAGALSRVKQFLAYKAESNGIVHVKQNEAYTSKTNCYTGEIIQNFSLSVRQIEITEGLTIDRDVNGAINIATKYFCKNQGTWSVQLGFLESLKDTRIYFDSRMSKFA